MYWYNKTLQHYKKCYNGDVAKENINKHKPNWSRIHNYSYRVLTIGASGFGKTNALLNLMKQQDDDDYSVNDKVYFYAKDLDESKYQYLNKKY